MSIEPQLSAQLTRTLTASAKPTDRVVLAFSGGMDSCVLLHFLAKTYKEKLLLWHINHGLQDCAGDMEAFCVDLASQYQLAIKVSHLQLGGLKGNVEAIAREARYTEFATDLNTNDLLITAHHADDQAETFWLNALRGSGSAGLRGISPVRQVSNSQVARPLLCFERHQLLNYAKQYQLTWFEDPSNQSDIYDRNYLRHQVLPNVKKRWPHSTQSIKKVCDIQAETHQLLDELATIDYQHCSMQNTKKTDCLLIVPLKALSQARQKNLIRYWLKLNHCDSLPASKLTELLKQLDSRIDAQPVIQANHYEVRRYNQRVFIVNHQPEIQLESVYELNAQSVLRIEGIPLSLKRLDVLQRFGLVDSDQSVSLRFRQSQVSNHYQHRLKHLFQDKRVPPWKRNVTPQVYIDDELVGLWLDD